MARPGSRDEIRELNEQDLPSGSIVPDDALDGQLFDEGGPGSAGGSTHAAQTPAGGTELGGLAGSTVGDGAPVNGDVLEDAFFDDHLSDIGDGGPPFSGSAGGAVGGTPAEGRAGGGKVRGGISPGPGSRRGDSTIGSDPDADPELPRKPR